MKLYFEDKFQEPAYAQFDLEDVVFTAEYVTLSDTPNDSKGNVFFLHGKAVIDGEEYPEFSIQFATEGTPEEYTLECILSLDWDWYDFVF